MKKRHQITVNNTFKFELYENDLVKLDMISLNDKQKHLLINNISHHISVSKKNFNSKTYEVIIDSEIFQVVIKNELDTLIQKMGFSLGDTEIPKKLNAPMPGFILDILIKKGQLIKKGDPVIILEAMKMENTLNAPMDGIIKAIHVTKGENAEKGTLLLEME